jgi:hypothetical protein
LFWLNCFASSFGGQRAVKGEREICLSGTRFPPTRPPPARPARAQAPSRGRAPPGSWPCWWRSTPCWSASWRPWRRRSARRTPRRAFTGGAFLDAAFPGGLGGVRLCGGGPSALACVVEQHIPGRTQCLPGVFETGGDQPKRAATGQAKPSQCWSKAGRYRPGSKPGSKPGSNWSTPQTRRAAWPP